jgi:hypothetical protein
MMKTKNLQRLAGLLLVVSSLCYGANAQSTITITTDQSNGNLVSIPCGGYYTSLLQFEDFNDGVSTKQDTWTITNDGAVPVSLQLPLTLSSSSSPNLTITSQPRQTLAAGESTTFTTAYQFSFGTNDIGFIAINTAGDPDNNCGFLLRGMIETVSLCQCYCTDNELQEICPVGIDGFVAGINVDDNLCENNSDDFSCSSVQLITSCDCNNVLTTETSELYVDTMRILGLPGTDIMVSDNVESTEFSFLNRNGASIRRGTSLGQINSRGFVDIPIFRRPTTSINVTLNGVNFRSETSCPLVADCATIEDNSSAITPEANMETIPTLSEWSVFLLGLILLIISVVALRTSLIIDRRDKKLKL